MLTVLRTKQRSFVIQVVFWVIIAAFVGTIFLVWGRGSDNQQAGNQAAAVINGTEVSYEEVQRSYSNLYRIYQNLYGDRFSPAMEKQLGLRQQAFDQLTNELLLLEEAGKRGLSVSHDDLVKSIADIPAFQENGVFSKERYIQVLNYQRLSAEQFELLQERQLLVEEVRDQIGSGATVSDADIETEFRNTNDKIVLEFLRYAPALFKDKVAVEEKSLAEFFEEKKEDYRIPNQIAVSYIKFDPAALADEVTLTDDEVARYYDRNQARYDVEEQVKAAHILVRVPSDADDATRTQKRELAEKILADARAGKDFAELAKTFSDDPGSAKNGGELGFFGRGTMVAAFEQAAFALKPGELSDVVETPFGYHIIKGEGYVEAGVKPLADVIDEVKAGLREELQRQAAFEKAIDAYNINRKSGSLEAAAESAKLTIQTTPLFRQGAEIPGIPQSLPLVGSAFSLDQGALGRPVTLPDGVYLFSVKEKQENHIPELSEVRSAVEKAYRKQEAERLAKAAAETALQAIKDGASLEKVAGEVKTLKIEATDPFPHSFGAFVPKIGANDELAKAAFELTAENPVAGSVFDVDGKYIVVKLKEQQPADPTELTDEKRNELRETLLAKRKDEKLKQELEALKGKAEIMVSPQLQNFLKEG